MASLLELAFGDIEPELDSTRRVLECVPDERFLWKPHEKSWHIGGLAYHMAQLPQWQTMILTTDELDLGSLPPPAEPPSEMSAVLGTFECNRAGLDAAIAAATEDGLSKIWTLRRGDFEIMKGPRAVVMRSVGVNHAAHHRGQMTVYLRLLGISVPMTYGPTADHRGDFGG